MKLDRYQLVRTIASGGMGQVYEALAHGHGGFSRRVAIKRLLPEMLDDGGARDLFRDEARIASHLHHSNIVQVLDYGEVDGTEFLVLEFVDGTDAFRLVRQHGPLPEPIALHIIAEIAHALAYAHELNDEGGSHMQIVHRDVSAHNILLSWEGDVKLSDFGIALAVSRNSRTKTGHVKGKFGHIAPEQLLGDRATPASDVYALGVTLWYLVHGSFPADSNAEPARAPRAHALVERCMRDLPGDRPGAADVAREASVGGVGRIALRDHLARGRDAVAPRRSALDDVMGLALVPAGDGRFTISKEIAISASEDATTGERREPPRRRRILLPLVLAAACAVGVLAVAKLISRGDRHPVEPRVPDAAAVSFVGTTDTVSLATADAFAPPYAVDAHVVDAVVATVDALDVVDAKRAHTSDGKRAQPRDEPAPIDASTAVPAVHGCVRGRAVPPAGVGDRFSINVSGKAVSEFIPGRIDDVPVGSHEVTIVPRGGAPFTRIVTVSSGPCAVVP